MDCAICLILIRQILQVDTYCGCVKLEEVNPWQDVRNHLCIFYNSVIYYMVSLHYCVVPQTCQVFHALPGTLVACPWLKLCHSSIWTLISAQTLLWPLSRAGCLHAKHIHCRDSISHCPQKPLCWLQPRSLTQGPCLCACGIPNGTSTHL